MSRKTEHFKLGDKTQDRMKLPSAFWLGLKASGLNPATLLRHCGLPLAVCGGDGVLTTRQYFALWRSVRELSKDPDKGWKDMQSFRSEQYHPALLAALNARTYRESLERLARYKQLCGAQEFRFTEDRGEVAVEVIWPFADDESPPPLLLDANFALVMELGRRGTGSHLTPSRIELKRPADPVSGLAEYFGCPVKYKARRDVLVLRARDLDLPFVSHNEELLQMIAPQLESQLKRQQSKPRVQEQVKWVLSQLLPGGRPDLATVAKELGSSERTLQRRITEAGTTFRDLLNETRREQARKHLANAAIEITEVAFLLGYDDPNSFYRAFRTWEGQTPGDWRSSQTA